MKNLIIILAGLIGIFSFTFSQVNDLVKVKCMVQLKNYTGEGAYIFVTVLKQDGSYVKTLKMLGDDEEWFPDLENWWEFYKKNDKPSIDGITGATIAGGERSIFVLEIDPKYVNSDYKLRFETAVEDQEYHETELDVDIVSDNFKGSYEGSGYIRYVRMIPN